ncbi:MAG TPA: nuclear transport factor 2 family protein [Gammaproteobacteria bacterium]|nr:nuclear transport factor 2 family protein [Gammaproteobacteria bacterium]
MSLFQSFRCGITLALAAAAVSATAQEDIQALADRWVQAYNDYDRAALGAVYTPNAELMMHGTPTIVGRDAIAAFWSADFQDRNPLTLLTVTHSVQGLDMMLVHGDYRVINREDGSLLGNGRFAHIWTRPANGQWQLDRDLWSEYFDPYVVDEQMNGDVQALADRWTQAYNRHDRDALQALYTPAAGLMLHGGPSYAGAAEIGAFWAEDFQEGNPLTLLTVTHALEGADMILVHGNYQVVSRDDGALLGAGRFAHIWKGDRRLRRGWLLDRDLWYERTNY